MTAAWTEVAPESALARQAADEEGGQVGAGGALARGISVKSKDQTAGGGARMMSMTSSADVKMENYEHLYKRCL